MDVHGSADGKRHSSDAKPRKAKAAAEPYNLYDGGGLFLLVQPRGARYWRLKYRSGGKEKLFAVGVYPETAWRMRVRAHSLREV